MHAPSRIRRAVRTWGEEISVRDEVRTLLGRPPMGRRGFTLLEVMIVVAIVGVVMALAGNATQANQRRARMHDAARQFRARVEHARTLAVAAGSSLGNTFANCATGTGPPANTLQLVVEPLVNAYQVPTSLAFNAGVTQSDCQSFSVADGTESRGTAMVTVNGGTARTLIAFTATGRLDPAVTPGPLLIRFEDSLGGEAERGYGIRILPSGVICAGAGTAATDGCNEDP